MTDDTSAPATDLRAVADSNNDDVGDGPNTDTDPDTADWPDELTDLSEAEKEQRAEELQFEVEQSVRELETEQREFLESLEGADAHEHDLIETPVTLPGDNAAHVTAELNGELLDRMAAVQDLVDRVMDAEDGDAAAITHMTEAMDRVATLLADLTDEPKYSKQVFYQIYERYGPEALGEHAQTIFEAIGDERERQAGAIDGFREQ